MSGPDESGAAEGQPPRSEIVADLRRRLYSREAAENPSEAARIRAQLEAWDADAADTRTLAPAPRPSLLRSAPPEQPQGVVAPEAEAEAEAPAPRQRSRRGLIGIVVVLAILVAGASVFATLTAPPRGDALSIFDDPAGDDDVSPFPPDYRLVGGSEVVEVRSLGRFDNWDTYAALLQDDQVCLIARQDDTSAATCATREQFASRGLSLGVSGRPSQSLGGQGQGDISIAWGPDEREAVKSDTPR